MKLLYTTLCILGLKFVASSPWVANSGGASTWGWVMNTQNKAGTMWKKSAEKATAPSAQTKKGWSMNTQNKAGTMWKKSAEKA
ncbi:hypothetical protein BB561_001264 [Smittium simulii]|uniref:Uncharacterized protein n=1 Tax=Smittium simulii TaxID=133385 RepID=A0A2T9YVI3_9FUNG|nr:hypothetical protein BB561_001264 [Smittium simulii]